MFFYPFNLLPGYYANYLSSDFPDLLSYGVGYCLDHQESSVVVSLLSCRMVDRIVYIDANTLRHTNADTILLTAVNKIYNTNHESDK